MGDNRIEAIVETTRMRIQRVQEFSMSQQVSRIDATQDDVVKDIAEDYTLKM